jgi:hypothetical protein
VTDAYIAGGTLHLHEGPSNGVIRSRRAWTAAVVLGSATLHVRRRRDERGAVKVIHSATPGVTVGLDPVRLTICADGQRVHPADGRWNAGRP